MEKVRFINEFGKKPHSNNQRYFPNPSIKEDLAPLDTITNHRKKTIDISYRKSIRDILILLDILSLPTDFVGQKRLFENNSVYCDR